MNKTLANNSKGVTPVVATTILITIAIAASFTAYTFIDSTIGGFQENVEDDLTEDQLERETSIDIDTAFDDNGDITMIIRNTGQHAVSFDSWQLYVDGQPSDLDLTDSSNWEESSQGLDPQITDELYTDVDFPEDTDDEPVTLEIVGEFVSASTVCVPGGSSC